MSTPVEFRDDDIPARGDNFHYPIPGDGPTGPGLEAQVQLPAALPTTGVNGTDLLIVIVVVVVLTMLVRKRG